MFSDRKQIGGDLGIEVWKGRDYKGVSRNLGDDDMSTILIVDMVSQLYTHGKTGQTAHLQYVYIIVHQLYLNKAA